MSETHDCPYCACKEFFIARFGADKYEFDQRTGYYAEWEKRFLGRRPEAYMDGESLAVWDRMKEHGWEL